MKNIIEVDNLVKKYKKAKEAAVRNVSFNVKEGEFFAFLGPNGAGKTTTISILNTTLSKTSGMVKVAGYEVSTNPDRVRQNIGVIFQNPSLDLNLTAEENIRFHVNLYGLYSYNPLYKLMPKDYKNKVEELANILGLQPSALFSPVKNLSGGMKRKLEIIRGLMHKPKVLFLDEPTTGLDPISRKSLWNYLQKVRQETNITIFLTTHYLEEAEGADNVCIIKEGEIVVNGSPNKIKQRLIHNYLKFDSNNREALENELKNKKISYQGSGPFTVDLNGYKVHDLLKSIQTPLTDINVYKPSLEDAYVEVIEGGSEVETQKTFL